MLYYEPSALLSLLELHRGKVAILTDSNTEQVCLPFLADRILSIMTENRVYFHSVPAGEHSKNLHEARNVLEKLQSWEFLKSDILLILGGGMLCDLGSFCASIYKRGLRHYLVPTSLLAMCDAAIGGKTGVNLENIKNSIGTFYPAEEIFALPEFLLSLPSREVISGFGEVIKHGILQSEEDFLAAITAFEYYQKNLTVPSEIIVKAANFKCKIVEQDPNEKDVRKILNYGHTIGHALESAWLMEGKDVPHGICILYGIIIENQIAVATGLLDVLLANRIQDSIRKIIVDFSLQIPSVELLGTLLLQDKKNVQDGINFSLIQDFGNPVFDIYLDKQNIIRVLEEAIII